MLGIIFQKGPHDSPVIHQRTKIMADPFFTRTAHDRWEVGQKIDNGEAIFMRNSIHVFIAHTYASMGIM